jgi:hypothetical protein
MELVSDPLACARLKTNYQNLPPGDHHQSHAGFSTFREFSVIYFIWHMIWVAAESPSTCVAVAVP